MKKLLLSAICFLTTTFLSMAQTYYYDSFDYPIGNLGLSTGPVTPAVNPATSTTNGNWNFGSIRSALVQVGSLTYSGLVTSASSTHDIKLINSSTTATNQRMAFASVGVTTPVYCSFLMKVSVAPAAVTRVASLIGTTRVDINGLGTYTANIQVDASGKVLLAPDNNGITAATAITSTSVVGTTVLVVVKYDPLTYKTDVWVNPESSTLGAGAPPTPLVAGIEGGATTDVSGFTFKTASSAVNAEIDELRIGASWAAVTPTTYLHTTGMGSGVWSDPAEWTNNVIPVSGSNVVVNHAIAINQNVTLNSIQISSGAKLTLNSGNTLSTSIFNINSDATNGTGTFVDLNSNGGVTSATTNVQQYLGTTRNWYISSPVSNALAKSGFTYYKRDESNASWPTVADGTPFSPGTGYIALPNATGATLTFSTESGGSLNAGDVSVALTASGATYTGFNLIGNPYPCHLGWTYDFANANSSLIESSIWIRTNAGTSNNSGQWSFTTYNATSSESVPSVANAGIIAPMQAFWVKAKTSGTLTLNSNLTRSHQSSNPLKSPAAKNSDRQRLRMEVSNGTATDETLVYFDFSAKDEYDAYDSPKFVDANTAVQIYTLAGSENLVINGMNSIPDTELPLGFKASSAGTYSLKASQFINFAAGTKIILKDYANVNSPVIKDLSDGSAYTFDSDAASTTTRFTLTFKAPSVPTDINSQANQTTSVFKNANGYITIVKNDTMNEGIVTIYNATGQKLITSSTTGTTTIIDKALTSGVYIVTVDVDNFKTTKKIILN